MAGRFAPSPTGPLHLGSLLAATGSWLFARTAGVPWFVRMEDLDTPRLVRGSTEEILDALEKYGLAWDGRVERQSERTKGYERALERLRASGLAYDCGCSRGEVARAASAPLPDAQDEGAAPVYPGTCRGGIRNGRVPRAVRFRVGPGTVGFEDTVLGRIEEETSRAVGDFVLKRADGPFAYQLAVVVDDAEQGITQVVRGADLVTSTPRQILLQRALGLRQPTYAHLPLLLGPDGRKLGKRDGALPLDTLDEARVRSSLRTVLRLLGQEPVEGSPSEILAEALRTFDPRRIPREPAALA